MCYLSYLRPRFPRDLDLDLRLSLLRDLRLGTVWVSGLCPLFLYTLYTGEGTQRIWGGLGMGSLDVVVIR